MSKLRTAIEMPNLLHELKLNIFSRLPVKALCVCKCVCREWLNTISDPYFLRLHLDRSMSNRQLLLLNQSSDDVDDNMTKRQIVRFFSASMEGDIQFRTIGFVGGYVHMIPSGHGLICLVNKGNFYIFNPGMKKAIKLPKPKPSTCKGIDGGFGYKPSTNEYKLVHLYDENEDEFSYSIKCEIFTLSEGSGTSSSWKQIEKQCPFIVRGWGVLANNKFYWMVWEGCHPLLKELIVSLDLETETFDFIPHPHVISYVRGNDMFLVEVQGQLCLIDTFAHPPVTHVWMLKDPVKKIWVKQCSIDLTKLEGFNNGPMQIFVLGHQNEELVISTQQERLNFFNIRTKVLRRSANLSLERESGLCLYTDTFFSLG
ncbi:hypothetical protein Pint_23250 [Pistacia integerrima]|uniref:Uncharacterized protein n=1 Tax=Pistacia integerrima TaxID=434235 RepID=A0ACC0YI47_9ROSI|nr:hypothetical protein Pint_23250 [Pistacia integerrima]